MLLLVGHFLMVREMSLSEYCFFFFQAEDGIRDLVRSRGLGDVYKRQGLGYLQEYTLVTVVKQPGKKSFVAIGFPGTIGVILSLIHI